MDTKFVDIVKNQLAAAKLSQAQLCRLAGIRPNTLSDWFRGAGQITVDQLERVLDVLKLPTVAQDAR